MPLKNYTTRMTVSRTAGEITRTLVKKGAQEILTQYNAAGEPSGLKWALETKHGRLAYELPVRYAPVFEALTNDGLLKHSPERRMQQAQRVAWRILRDWIEAQIALLESGMVSMDEVFLPYMLTDNGTIYETMDSGGFRSLPRENRPAIALGGPTHGAG